MLTAILIVGDDVRGACHTSPALVGQGRRRLCVNTKVPCHTTTGMSLEMAMVGVKSNFMADNLLMELKILTLTSDFVQ